MAHAFVTVAIPFPASKADEVDAHLEQLGNPARDPVAAALTASGFVHFMSLTVVRIEGQDARLVLEASADGAAAGALARLVATIGATLARVLDVAGVPLADQALGDFLERHRIDVNVGWRGNPGVCFAGTPGMSVERILRERDLAARIQELIPERPPENRALEALAHVRDVLWREGTYKWAFQAEPVPLLQDAPPEFSFVKPMLASIWSALLWPLLVIPALVFLWFLVFPVQPWSWGAVLAIALGALWRSVAAGAVEFVLAAAAGVLAYGALRRQEEADDPPDLPPSPDLVGDLMMHENHVMQNNLAAASTMKPGALRRFTLRLVFWIVGELATYRAQPGFLSGIGTIHFARWVLLPGTDRLLFYSNYSGSWQSYLEDFIELAHQGLTGVWSNTIGFPKAQNLFNKGAQDGDRFKRWARRQQRPTRFWYAAYPRLTTERIRKNAGIRYGFASITTELAARAWLTLLNFAPAEQEVALPDIPVLVFGGVTPLHFGCGLVVRLADDRVACRSWVGRIEKDVTYGERPRKRDLHTGAELAMDPALVVGFTATGLRKLGVDELAVETFPVAFQHGMSAPWRSRILGDEGPDAPANWAWGGPGREADALLVVYAPDADSLKRFVAARVQELEELHHGVVYSLMFQEVPEKAKRTPEPFGFADGISQPIVRGTTRWTQARNSVHVIEPGEMILGYKDNLGFVPPAVSVAPGADPGNLLPLVPADPSEPQNLRFVDLERRRHDLGRNGTFLVVRQLEQLVGDFHDFTADTAEKLRKDGNAPPYDHDVLSRWVAAKMVGRWQNGLSLVRNPDPPELTGMQKQLPDNDFLFGKEDESGVRCPFGAHIRRANPRDGLVPRSPKQLEITNRHRILRVGRRYDPQNGLKNPGLFFMCINADIEGQFEFLQQTWIHEPSFDGLVDEVDPIIGRRGMSGNYTIPTASGPISVDGLRNFVQVRGGAYFFLPGRQALAFLAKL